MNLEKLFQIFLEQAKKQALTLCDIERTVACQWIKKIELVQNQDSEVKKLQLHSLKLLLLSIESNCLVGPFKESPIDDKEFTEYNWDSYQLADFSNMIRSKRDTQKRPEVSYAVSSNRRELVTFQNDPATGQHCYYACSKQPIEEWNNLQNGVIKNQSIDQWKERAEYEELNEKESQNSSFDEPRCVMHATDSQVNLNEDQYPKSSRRCQRVHNLSNVDANPSKSPRCLNHQRINFGRPETPQGFGGRGNTIRPYEMEEFGLSQNEQFCSPRRVFQNLDNDRFQTHRSPMPSRLTDEVIESFENSRINRGPVIQNTTNNEAKQQLCARLQKIRDGMNKKPQVEIEHPIEIEPDMIPYERITLQEPCENSTSHDHETDQDLGILSTGDMDDEVLFGEHRTIDPRTIFKTKDENLVSRNVVKIETNTTINGSKREVTEEILEQEDINVVDRTEDDENLVDVSEPAFESYSGYSPVQRNENSIQNAGQWRCNRVLADYSDFPQEDLENVSKPSFQQGSYEEQKGPSEIVNLTGGERRSMRELERVQRDNSERLQNVSEPIYAPSYDQSGQSETFSEKEQPKYQSLEESSNKSRKCKFSSNQRPMVQVETMADLDEESQVLFEDASGLDRGLQSYRQLPLVEASEQLDEISQPRFFNSTEVSNQTRSKNLSQGKTSERLDDVSHPDFASSFEHTYQSSSRRNRCPLSKMSHVEASDRIDEISQPSFVDSTKHSHQDSGRRSVYGRNQRPLPQGELSENLDDVSHPFGSSFQDTNQSSLRGNRCQMSKRDIPQVDTLEKLDQITNPGFVSSFQDSRVKHRERSDLPQMYESERLEEISQPEFLHSTGPSYQNSKRRTRCQMNSRQLPKVETSDMSDQVSRARYLSSGENTSQNSVKRRFCPSRQRPFPRDHTLEKLDDVSHPNFEVSFQDSTDQGRQYRCKSPYKPLPRVNISERLDEVSQPEFCNSTKASFDNNSRSTTCPRNRRLLPQVELSENLDQISHPQFLSSIEDTFPDSTSRRKCPTNRRTMPQVDTSEKLDDISKPSFGSSLQDYTVPSRRGRLMSPYRCQPSAETSERLDEVSQPEFSHSVETSYENNSRSTTCPPNRRLLPQVETSENLDQISRPQFVSSFEDTFPGSTSRGKFPMFRKAMPQVDTSEKLDDISKPSFGSSFQDYTVPSRRGRLMSPHRCQPSVETSERLDEVSQPEFSHSVETSYENNSRSTTCPRNRRLLPQIELSENLDQISRPQFVSSIEDIFPGSTSRGKCPMCRKAMPQVDTSEKLDEISKPSFGPSIPDYKISSRRGKLISPQRFQPFAETSERLDEVSQPEFLHSTKTSYQDTTGRTMCSRNRRPLCQEDTSEILDQVSHPKFLSSIEDTNEDGKKKSELSEDLEHVSQPAFMVSEFLSSIEDNLQQSGRRTQDRNLIAQDNVSEKLADVSQPFCPSSFEESGQRSRQNKQKSVDEYNTTSDQICQRNMYNFPHDPIHRPYIEESEILDAVIQPDLTFFEDTGYESKDSLQILPQRPFHEVEETGRLEDISQPNFQFSFKDSTIQSNRNRHTKERRPLTFDEESERLSYICQPNLLNNTRQTPGYENLDDVCQPTFQSSFENSNQMPYQCSQESSHISRIRKQNPRRRLLSRIDRSEALEDVSQPFYPSSFEDSMCDQDRRYLSKRKPHRTSCQVSGLEYLDNVPQPGFQSTFDETRHAQSGRLKTAQTLPWNKINTLEELNDVSQPIFPNSFEDSMKNTGSRIVPAPKGRPLPNIDLCEKLEDVCQPSFGSSLEKSSDTSRKCDKILEQRPFFQIDESSEQLDDISQPSGFVSSSKHSTVMTRGTKQTSVKQRPFSEIDESEILNEITQPNFATTIESTIPSCICPSKKQQRPDESKVSERQDNVCQPSFRKSFDDSRHCSRSNDLRQNKGSISRNNKQNVDQTEALCSLYRSNRRSERAPIDFYTSEMLEDIVQPEFPSTLQESSNISRQGGRIVMGNRPMPQVDISENIANVCQPHFPSSFDDSTRDEVQNLSSTYRKNRDYVTNFPKERVDDISAPTFQDSNYAESRHRVRNGFSYLTKENLEDVSCPSFQTTPKLPAEFRRQDFQSPRRPPRQLFPRKDSTNREQIERPDDFRQVFEEMPNYAPFEQQVARKRNPIASKLRMPVNFTCPMAPLTKNEETFHPNARDFRDCRMRPPILREACPSKRNQMYPKHPGPTLSSTRIPPPRSARTRINVQVPEQTKKMEKQPNQERLVKKSSVKFQQTKATYFKNKPDQSTKNQKR